MDSEQKYDVHRQSMTPTDVYHFLGGLIQELRDLESKHPTCSATIVSNVIRPQYKFDSGGVVMTWI